MSKKRILFIGPKFFGYQDVIKLELERLGYIVDWFDERPSSTPLIKALIRFFPKLVAPISDAYFDKILLQTKNHKYDIVFVIKGEAISVERLRRFKEVNINANFVYYTWDSLKNFKNGIEKLGFFDKVYSFDRSDAESIESVRHLPLFFIPAYEQLADKGTSNFDIDLLFLGSIHSDRYPVMMRITHAARSAIPLIKIHTHFFYQSRWVFFVKKIIDVNFRKIPWSDIEWLSLNEKRTLTLISRSKVIVDIHHPGQTGLTMRTIECVGAKKKLITTNAEVANYDFYNQKNILIIDRKNPIIYQEFFKEDYVALGSLIYKKYSLNAWLCEVLS
ncbi:capsular biosynthesis protein CpsH [Glaciimonas sp. PCH181]|uniref:capsular biosynthesis protein CpsH n=1 Tax=Glaciimonas sp. PCH181 TaxID=2133943 RepID=UPI000D3741B6|nr:capsular biosynthesis protein CpsH [Glaciimonas sp. PCH181]PUA20521.1 capsular biosynthesis protein CpsH [Glaciimonas sp. PCH181]